MTTGGDMGKWDPFEDTGDWPFRDAPPRPESAAVAAEEEPPEVAPQGAIEDTALEASAPEPEPEPVSEPMSRSSSPSQSPSRRARARRGPPRSRRARGG